MCRASPIGPSSCFQKLPNFFFSPQAVFPAFGEETQLGVSGYLELRLDFLPSHSLRAKKEKIPGAIQETPRISSVGLSTRKKRTTNSGVSLSPPIPYVWVALVFAGMHVSNKHNTVRPGCGASSSVRRWLPPFPPSAPHTAPCWSFCREGGK